MSIVAARWCRRKNTGTSHNMSTEMQLLSARATGWKSSLHAASSLATDFPFRKQHHISEVTCGAKLNGYSCQHNCLHKYRMIMARNQIMCTCPVVTCCLLVFPHNVDSEWLTKTKHDSGATQTKFQNLLCTDLAILQLFGTNAKCLHVSDIGYTLILQGYCVVDVWLNLAMEVLSSCSTTCQNLFKTHLEVQWSELCACKGVGKKRRWSNYACGNINKLSFVSVCHIFAVVRRRSL